MCVGQSVFFKKSALFPLLYLDLNSHHLITSPKTLFFNILSHQSYIDDDRDLICDWTVFGVVVGVFDVKEGRERVVASDMAENYPTTKSINTLLLRLLPTINTRLYIYAINHNMMMMCHI